jgi:hypothetical protein
MRRRWHSNGVASFVVARVNLILKSRKQSGLSSHQVWGNNRGGPVQVKLSKTF